VIVPKTASARRTSVCTGVRESAMAAHGAPQTTRHRPASHPRHGTRTHRSLTLRAPSRLALIRWDRPPGSDGAGPLAARLGTAV
jgi:hypothetical protein